MTDICEAFREARKALENLTGQSFYGGGLMDFKNIQGFLDGVKDTDSTDFHTHSGWITSEKYPTEEYKIVIMIIGRNKP